jgi:hypothetical protein
MNHELIYDYIDNSRPGKQIQKVTLLEDFIDTHPEKQEVVLSVYSLYNVEYTDSTSEKFILSAGSANVLFAANQDSLKELFPDYADKQPEIS